MAEQKLQINITPEMAEGKYANLAIIAHSSSEFIVDFIRMMPNQQQANVKSRIILTPEHAKRLLMALQDNINKYENQYGKIQTGNNNIESGVPTIPMSFGGGQA